jgi:hypothetical protein
VAFNDKSVPIYRTKTELLPSNFIQPNGFCTTSTGVKTLQYILETKHIENRSNPSATIMSAVFILILKTKIFYQSAAFSKSRPVGVRRVRK